MNKMVVSFKNKWLFREIITQLKVAARLSKTKHGTSRTLTSPKELNIIVIWLIMPKEQDFLALSWQLSNRKVSRLNQIPISNARISLKTFKIRKAKLWSTKIQERSRNIPLSFIFRFIFCFKWGKNYKNIHIWQRSWQWRAGNRKKMCILFKTQENSTSERLQLFVMLSLQERRRSKG